MAIPAAKTLLICGHYGSGKTNLALNIAMELRRRGETVTLADLDIVNPYFRTADFRDFAAENGIELVASDYAGSSLDIPALTGRLDGAIGRDGTLMIDVGGDDAGAIAVGRYAPRIRETGYNMLYVVNSYRLLMREPEESLRLLRDIEDASRLKATHIANCSNLGPDTRPEEVRASLPYAQRISQLAGLPVALTAAHTGIAEALRDVPTLFPVEVYVKKPWEHGLT